MIQVQDMEEGSSSEDDDDGPPGERKLPAAPPPPPPPKDTMQPPPLPPMPDRVVVKKGYDPKQGMLDYYNFICELYSFMIVVDCISQATGIFLFDLTVLTEVNLFVHSGESIASTSSR